MKMSLYSHPNKAHLLPSPVLVPVRRFPRPSPSIHFGDVFELGPRDPKRFDRAE